MSQRFAYLENFLSEECGQDLIEYSLLIVFIAIACAAIVGQGGSATTPIWSSANSQLAVDSASAS